MRGAFLHMAVDALGSVAVIAAAISVLAWNAPWVDPLASILIAVLVLWSAWHLLRETTHVLLEGTPKGMSVEEVEQALQSQGSVKGVHHLHLWSVASDVAALSGHVVLEDDISLHDAQLEGERLKSMLHERFAIQHATLELECHACEPQDGADTAVARGRGAPQRDL